MYQKIHDNLWSEIVADLYVTTERALIDYLVTGSKDIGVYVLYWCGFAIYVGKSNDSIRRRLSSHSRKLGRESLVQEATFRYIPLPGNLIHSGEQMMIEYIGKPLLNGTDFGSNGDPAREQIMVRTRDNWVDPLTKFIEGLNHEYGNWEFRRDTSGIL